MTSRTWMNPPIVYPLTNPRSHMIMRITKIVHSMSFSFSAEPCSLTADGANNLFKRRQNIFRYLIRIHVRDCLIIEFCHAGPRGPHLADYVRSCLHPICLPVLLEKGFLGIDTIAAVGMTG